MKKTLQKIISILTLFILSFGVFGQSFKMQPPPAKNWQNESIDKDSVYGTGSDKALDLLKGRKSTTVVVAVIDGGVQINHPALKDNIWVNPRKTGDKNDKYTDDVHGWDFIGGKDGDVKQENLELTRLYRDLSKKYANVSPDKISKDDAEYATYIKVKKDYETKKAGIQAQYDNLKGFMDTIALVKAALNKKDLTIKDVDSFSPADSGMAKAKRKLVRNLNRFGSFMKGASADTLIKFFKPVLEHLNTQLAYQYNVDFNPRNIVGDNYADATESLYGNNDVIGPTDMHGTHVSGIIAGMRNSKSGQEGIADNVKIMVLRVVPDGDERDKDVANGIRYAVDNGAKVINMSFGKAYSYNKKAVDDAVKYAEAHDVLLVHAAGNDHSDNDTVEDFPNRRYEGGHKEAQNWIEVGASDSKGMPGSFSNYGKKSVDLFAPGVRIYSTMPDSGYAYLDGTSMASPCVAGVAAIIREYFPKLKAKEVRKILMKSVTKTAFNVPTPGHKDKMVPYSDLCISGGLINADKAIQLAIKKEGMPVLNNNKLKN